MEKRWHKSVEFSTLNFYTIGKEEHGQNMNKLSNDWNKLRYFGCAEK